MDAEAAELQEGVSEGELNLEEELVGEISSSEKNEDVQNREELVELEKEVPETEQVAHHTAEEAKAVAERLAEGDFDIFTWANNLFQHKDQLKIDLFMINKNNVIYRTKFSPEVEKQLQPLFITPMLEYLMMGAGAGMVVRAFEDAEAEDNVLQYTKWENILRLTEVMHWMHTQEKEMEFFDDQEHDLKRIKGVLARCNHPSMADPFYVIKVLPSAQTFKGDGAWMVHEAHFMPFEAPAFRIPNDNQMVVIGDDIFVFNQAKLDRMFGYNAKKNSIAEKKVKEIETTFKLSFAEGMDMQSLVKGNKATINKLQKLEIGEITQDDLLDHASEIGVELMVDDAGAIIIEGTKDLTTFVNLLNDDYYESHLTGIKYEIRGKRPMKPPKEDDALEP